MTEGLAEYWHSRIRAEWGIDGGDSAVMSRILKQEYTGERYSFGYPACPDLEQQTLLAAKQAMGLTGVWNRISRGAERRRKKAEATA